MVLRLRERARLRRAPPWLDPHDTGKLETDQCKTVKPAEPTGGPNRLTISVPSESTYLSLGQALPSKHERGIDGHTDRHIHFHTPTTTVLLGKDCQILPDHIGYSMVTKENSYQHADKQSCFVSQNSQVVLRTAGARGNAVLQSDTGTAEIAAGSSVDIQAAHTVYITAGGGYTAHTGTYDQPWINANRDGGVTAHVAKWATIAYCAQVALVTMGGFVSSIKQCKDRTSSVGVELMQAVPKGTAAVFNIMACMAALGDSPNSIRLSADLGIGIASKKTVMFGHILSCMTTLGGATLAAITAEIKGWAMATVWAGHTATLSSSRIAKVSSPFGHVVWDATGTASFATDDELLVAAKEKVSLRADNNAVGLYGHESAYVGSGDGYGLFVDGKSVAMGKMTKAKEFKSPGLDKKYAVLVKQGTVHVRHGDDAMLHVSDRKTTILKRDNDHFVKVSSQGVLVKGREIHVE